MLICPNHRPSKALPRWRPASRTLLLCVVLSTAAFYRIAAQSPSEGIGTLIPASNAATESDQGLQLAEKDIRNEEYAKAIQRLRPIVQASPNSWHAHYDLGFALLRVKEGPGLLAEDLRESIQELSRSLQINDRNADAHKALGLDLNMIQREDLAGVEFAEAVRLAPASAENHYFLGRHYMQVKEYSRAAPELRKATELEPNYIKAIENLGITLDLLGSTEEALKELQRAVALDEKNILHSEWPYLDLSKFYHDHGYAKAAMPLALKAVGLNPRSEEALLHLAILYRANQNWQSALDVLQKAETLNSNAAETQYLLGRTYKALGNLPKSQQAFNNFDRLRRQSELFPVR